MTQEEDDAAAPEGQPLREEAYHGPVKSRSCTDVLCLLLYLAFVAVWAAIAVFAFVRGDPMRVVNPTDSQGLTCGIDEMVKDKPYLFFFDMLECTKFNSHGQCPTPQICVTSCPAKDEDFSSFRIQSASNLDELKRDLICKYDVELAKIKTKDAVKRLISNEACAKSYMESIPKRGRCIPKKALELVNTLQMAIDQVEDATNSSITMKFLKYIKKIDSLKEAGKFIVADLLASWPFILVAMVQAMFLSLLFLYLLKLIVTPLVWASAIGSIILLTFLLAVSIKNYGTAEMPEEFHDFSFSDLFRSETYELFVNTKPFWFSAAVLAGALLLIVLVLVIFLRNRLKLATAIIEEASKAVHSAKAALIFPTFIWIFQALVFLLFIAVAIYLYTAVIPVYKVTDIDGVECNCTDGTTYKDGSECDPSDFASVCEASCKTAKCKLNSRVKDEKTPLYHFLNLVGLLWTLCFSNAFEQMVLSGAFASWYWTLSKKFVPFFIVTQSAGRTLRYHMGTIAFGSMILASCKTIRIIIHVSQVVLKKYQKYRPVQVLFTACQCFFWLVEKILKFVSSNAYVMCAIHGKNFCTSARSAFALLVNNLVRAIVLDRMTDFMLLLGKLLIVSLLCFSWYLFFDSEMDIWITKAPKLHFSFLPLVIIAIATYFVSTQFLYVYSVAVKTIFICFLEDCEVNDGTSEKPYCMSTSLLKVFGAKNVKSHED